MRKSLACIVTLLSVFVFTIVFHLQSPANHEHEAMEISAVRSQPFLQSCRYCGAWRWMAADQNTALSTWTMAAHTDDETTPLDLTATTVASSVFQPH